MKNVLICGAGGFIGGHLAQYLKKLDKYTVTTMSKKALNLLNLIQI